MRTELGKIQSCEFGRGGYQDVMIGIQFTLGDGTWGVTDFWGEWATTRTASCQWTEEDRVIGLGKVAMRIKELLTDAQKEHISQLEGIPVEVTFEGNTLKSWRILKEVL